MAVTIGLARELLKVCIRNVLRGAEVHAQELEQRLKPSHVDQMAFLSEDVSQDVIAACFALVPMPDGC